MGRKLRVDFSNEGGAGGNDDSGHHSNNDRNQSNNYNPPPSNGANDSASGGPLPPLPAGASLPPGVTCTDAISRTLNTLPPAQLLDILSSMKQLASTDPARATELLNQAPQLSYAVFQGLLLMGLVSPEAINAVLEPGSMPAPAAAPSAIPSGYPPVGGGYPGVTNTPPVAAPAPYAAPIAAAAPTPVPAPAAPAPGAGGAPGQDQDALIQQVLSLPEEVIQQLPEAEKAAIMQLRAQFTGQRA